MASLIHCERCGGNYEAVGFRKAHALYASSASGRHPICIGCEQTERDAEKIANRLKIKARDTLRRHAAKYIKTGLVASQEEFAKKFGWDLDRMIHDIEHIYDNWCGCGAVFKEMGHGLSDITLDICDPRLPPHYASNTRWICQTCNRAKGRMPIELWGARNAYWIQWRKQQDKLKENPLAACELFDYHNIPLPALSKITSDFSSPATQKTHSYSDAAR